MFWTTTIVAALIVAADDSGPTGSFSTNSGRLLQPPKSFASISPSATVARTPPTIDVVFWSDLSAAGSTNDQATPDKTILWSSWGEGCLASNGKYYTSIGDHRGKDANCFLYEYDPHAIQLRRVVDVSQTIGQKPGAYGHGKIHSGIHESRDGWLYFATYWGKHREVEQAFGPDYQGSLLLRYHPARGQCENLGAVVPRHGLPASYFDSRRQLLYFHAVYDAGIAVLDMSRGSEAGGEASLRFRSEKGSTDGNRTFLGDADGRVYFSAPDGCLHFFDPPTNAIHPTTIQLPATSDSDKNTLRAAARPTRENVIYGMTQAGRLFSFHPKENQVHDLGPNCADGIYTAAMVLSPDDRFLYFAPGAHGSGAELGSPVIQYNVATRERKVLAFLNEELRSSRKYNLGGSYNLQIDNTGSRLYFTFNGAHWDAKARKPETFGHPCVVVVHIPESER